MGELLPCPFCGAGFKMGQEPHDSPYVGGQFYLYHDYGPLGSAARKCPISVNGHFETEELAIAAWNRRAKRTAAPIGGLPERIWLDTSFQPCRVWTIEMTDLQEYVRALPAAAPAEPNAVEPLVADAARAARNVFADYGSKAREAIDYMEQHILAELRRSE